MLFSDRLFQELAKSGEPHPDVLLEFLSTRWIAVGRKRYPPWYAWSLGRFPTHPSANRRLREFLETIPRANPERYEVLFNVVGDRIDHMGPTWDVVKWLEMPEACGRVMGEYWLSTVVLEPEPAYSFPATRPSWALSGGDFEKMRRWGTTIRGEDAIDRELMEARQEAERDHEREKEDRDWDFAHYYHKLFRRAAEEQGII